MLKSVARWEAAVTSCRSYGAAPRGGQEGALMTAGPELGGMWNSEIIVIA